MAEDDGAATEIFVVDLPISQLPTVVSALCELPTLEVLSFEDEGLEHPVPLNAEWCARLESIPGRNCQHSLLSASGTPQHLQVYVWVNVTEAAIEVEFVFWNDLTFPQDLASKEYEERLAALVSIAEACRVGVRSAKCVLTPEHNGPTDELFEKPNVLIW